MTDLISVILLLSDDAAALQSALSSVQTQSYQNLEIICIDNHAADDSLQIVQQAALHDPRIKIHVLGKHASIAAALNIGLEQAQGQAVCFLNPIGRYSREYIELMAAALEKQKAPLAVCAKLVETKVTADSQCSAYINLPFSLSSKEITDIETLEPTDLLQIPADICCKLYRLTPELRRLRFDDKLQTGAGELFSLELLLTAKRFAVLSAALYIERASSMQQAESEKFAWDPALLLREKSLLQKLQLPMNFIAAYTELLIERALHQLDKSADKEKAAEEIRRIADRTETIADCPSWLALAAAFLKYQLTSSEKRAQKLTNKKQYQSICNHRRFYAVLAG